MSLPLCLSITTSGGGVGVAGCGYSSRGVIKLIILSWGDGNRGGVDGLGGVTGLGGSVRGESGSVSDIAPVTLGASKSGAVLLASVFKRFVLATITISSISRRL